MAGFGKIFGSRRHGRERFFVFVVVPLLLLGVAAGLLAMFCLGQPGGKNLPPRPPGGPAAAGEQPSAALASFRSLSKEDKVVALHMAGGRAIGEKKYGEAVNRFRDITELQPGNAKAWNNLGAALLLADRNEEGVRALARSISLDPEDPKVHLNRADGLRKLGRLEEAIHDQQEALKKDPTDIVEKNRLLLLRIEAGQAEAVRAEVKSSRALELLEPERNTIMAAVYLDVVSGDLARAKATLIRAQGLLSPEDFQKLCADSAFARAQGELSGLKPGKKE